MQLWSMGDFIGPGLAIHANLNSLALCKSNPNMTFRSSSYSYAIVIFFSILECQKQLPLVFSFFV